MYIKYGKQPNINALQNHIDAMIFSIDKETDNIISLKVTKIILDIYKEIINFRESAGYSTTEPTKHIFWRSLFELIVWIIVLIILIIILIYFPIILSYTNCVLLKLTELNTEELLILVGIVVTSIAAPTVAFAFQMLYGKLK